MDNNEKATFRDCLKITKNILLTGGLQQISIETSKNEIQNVLNLVKEIEKSIG